MLPCRNITPSLLVLPRRREPSLGPRLRGRTSYFDPVIYWGPANEIQLEIVGNAARKAATFGLSHITTYGCVGFRS